MSKRLLVAFFAVSALQSLSGQIQFCIPGSQSIDSSQTTKLPIRRVSFHNASDLSVRMREQIVADVRRGDGGGSDAKPDFNKIAEETADRVRTAYQDEGYFNVEVKAKSISIAGDPLHRYDIAIQVIGPGQQYRFGELNIVNSTQFANQKLRDLFPIAHGEIFSRRKIVQGLENIRRLYESQGYINYTGLPSTAFDSATANLTIDIDEGKRFRVRSIDVLGVSPDDKTRLLDRLTLKAGDVYNPEALDAALPNAHADKRWIVQNHLDEDEGFVDVVLDLRPKMICPSPATPCEVNGRLQSCSDHFLTR